MPAARPRARDARRARSTTRRPARPAATTCRRATRSATRTRDGPALTVFPAFADVPAYPLVFPLFWGAAAIFALAMARHLRVFARGPQREPDRSRRSRACGGRSRYALVQTRMFRDLRAGLLHAGIFWGFVLLTIGTANIVTGGLVQAIISIPFDGALWAAVMRAAERRRGRSSSSSIA